MPKKERRKRGVTHLQKEESKKGIATTHPRVSILRVQKLDRVAIFEFESSC